MQIQLSSRDFGHHPKNNFWFNLYNGCLAWDMPHLLQARKTEQELGMFLNSKEVKERTDMLSRDSCLSPTHIPLSPTRWSMVQAQHLLFPPTHSRSPLSIRHSRNSTWRWQNSYQVNNSHLQVLLVIYGDEYLTLLTDVFQLSLHLRRVEAATRTEKERRELGTCSLTLFHGGSGRCPGSQACRPLVPPQDMTLNTSWKATATPKPTANT